MGAPSFLFRTNGGKDKGFPHPFVRAFPNGGAHPFTVRSGYRKQQRVPEGTRERFGCR